MVGDIDKHQDVMDCRDVIARFEELETELTDACAGESEDASVLPLADWIKNAAKEQDHTLNDAAIEYLALQSFLDDLQGSGGGDEEWRGHWYPVTLVRETYFEDYAQELAEELDLIKSDAPWPNSCIDWEQAAKELRMNYAGSDFDGITYYSR
jgi:hypothetical protein